MADAAKALKVGDPKHDYRHWPAIRAMILANPAWVRDDEALLDTLALRAAAENVVEFGPAAVAKLSDARAAEASARTEVEATAHANFEAQMRAQSAVIDLLEAADASDLAAQVDAAARTRFDLAAGALAIEGTPPDGWSTLPRGFVDHLLGAGSVRFGPVIGADTLFGACAAEGEERRPRAAAAVGRPGGPAQLRRRRARALHPRHGRRAGLLPRPHRGADGRALRAALMPGAEAALDGFIAYLAHERRASPRTLESYRHGIERYLAFLSRHRGEAIAERDLAGVQAAELRAYLARRREDDALTGDQPLSPRSLSQALSAIRSFHRLLDRRLRRPQRRPGPGARPAREAARAPRPVTEDQACGLIAEAGRRRRPRGLGGGPRRGGADPALRLRPADLRGAVAEAVRRAAARDACASLGKGCKTRIVPVLPAVREAVDAYLAALPLRARARRAAVPRQARRRR